MSWRSELAAACAIVVALVLLGAPLGLVWAHIGPHARAIVTAQGVTLQNVETKAFIAADFSFFALTFAAGAVTGVLTRLALRRDHPATAVALVIAGLLAALVAWRVGHRVGLASFRHFLEHGRPGEQRDAIVQVRAKGVLLGWPLGAVVGYLATVGWLGRRQDLSQRDHGASHGLNRDDAAGNVWSVDSVR